MFSRNLPIFLVFGAAFAIGVVVLIVAVVRSDDDGPQSTLSEFEAAQAAKSAYYEEDPTVEAATCEGISWNQKTDVWSVNCYLVREGGIRESTGWQVTPDGVAVRALVAPTQTPQP
jgi:hypothetical protein